MDLSFANCHQRNVDPVSGVAVPTCFRESARRFVTSSLAGLATLGATWMVEGVPCAAAQEQPSLALNRYTPAPAGDRFFGVADAEPGEHLVPHALVVFDYSHDPLVVESENQAGEEVVQKVVEHQLYAHLGGAIGLFHVLKLDVSIPVALYQKGDSPTLGSESFESPSGASFGDIRLGARGQLWAQKSGFLTLAVGGYLWLPTGSSSEGSFTSDGSVRGMPMVMASGQVRSFVYSFTTGVDLRPGQDYGGTPQGTSFQMAAAAGLLLGPRDTVQIGPEANLALTLDDIEQQTTNSEVLLGAKWRFLPAFVAGLGAGGGLAGGVGSPDFRALASFAFSPEKKKDTDGDGIFDSKDACPNEVGEANDDPKLNGCPVRVSDRDHDGIPDSKDSCPDDEGPKSEDLEKNGCPDGDGDGIVDRIDACPEEPGVEDEDPGKNGCPADRDGDGVSDSVDSCPDIPGRPSEDESQNGCPPDRDGDGILDEEDACPDAPGQENADPHLNGCPDKDNDGILDAEDACPDKWGRADKDPKKHGCPVVEVGKTSIVILQKIRFAINSSTIDEASFPLLDDIAQVLKNHPELRLVEIQGHTDSRGSLWLNTKLSKDRAASVRMAMIGRGIEESRLTSQGYGPTRPLGTNATDEGREKNRRVEFQIIQTKPIETKKKKGETK